MGWDGMGWDGMGWDGMGWDGMGWDGMGWDGMGWDGMGWDGMGWDGMGWDGMGWDGDNIAAILPCSVFTYYGSSPRGIVRAGIERFAAEDGGNGARVLGYLVKAQKMMGSWRACGKTLNGLKAGVLRDAGDGDAVEGGLGW